MSWRCDMKCKMLAFLVVLMFFISLTQFGFAAPPTDNVLPKPLKQATPLGPAQSPLTVGGAIKTPPPITIQNLYRVTCTDRRTVCSCAKPTDIVISGGGKCGGASTIGNSYPATESTWYISCTGIAWRGGSLDTLQRSQDYLPKDQNPLWAISGGTPLEIDILCAKIKMEQ